MKLLSFVCSLLFICTFVPSAFAGARYVGNGGGGLIRNGLVLTFGSAQIPLHVVPSMQTIPGLEEAQKGIESLNISPELKAKILSSLFPDLNRRYFKIEPGEIPAATYQKLLKTYGRIVPYLNVGKNQQVVLMAMTSKSETYLLPDFFKIEDKIGQAAVLLHEALWVLDPSLETVDNVSIEIAFEKYLRGKNDVGIYYQLASRLPGQEGSIVINAYIDHDLANKNLGTLPTTSNGANVIALSNLFGDSISTKFLNHDFSKFENSGIFYPSDLANRSVSLNFDRSKWTLHVEQLRQKYPQSLFLLFLAQNVNALDLFISRGDCQYSSGGFPFAHLFDDRLIKINLETGMDFYFPGEECNGAHFGVDCLNENNKTRVFSGNPISPEGSCSTQISIALPNAWSGGESTPSTQSDIKNDLLLPVELASTQYFFLTTSQLCTSIYFVSRAAPRAPGGPKCIEVHN